MSNLLEQARVFLRSRHGKPQTQEHVDQIAVMVPEMAAFAEDHAASVRREIAAELFEWIDSGGSVHGFINQLEAGKEQG